MKFREIFRFELLYQLRRLATWVCFAALFAFGFLIMRAGTPAGGAFINGPCLVAVFTVMGGVIWLLLAASVVGDSACRDIETQMHPLTYTAPVSKAAYLGGRFLAAYLLNASMLFTLQAGILLSVLLPGIDPQVLGPFRAAGHITAYFLLALPNAFAATAIQFAVALPLGRAMASYIASVLLLVVSLTGSMVAVLVRQNELARLLDPIGFVSVVVEMESSPPIEWNARLIMLEPAMLANRLVWIAVGIGSLASAYRGFRFDDRVARRACVRIPRRLAFAKTIARQAHAPAFSLSARPDRHSAQPGDGSESTRVAIPAIQRNYGFVTHMRQVLTIGWISFLAIVRSRTGLTLVGALAFGSAFVCEEWMLHMEDIPLLPRTEEVLAFYAPSLSRVGTLWVIIPLLTIFYAGELVWRERDAGMSEMADAAPVPDWALFVGKFLGLGLVLIVWMTILMAAGMLVQVVLGYPEFDMRVYLTVLFGFQLADYLLLALLVLVVHMIVGQKHLGHIAALSAYGSISFAPNHLLGIEHKLLVYGSDLGWSYTPMNGFGPFVGPWLWFKLYWAAWALLLAVSARLLLTRGMETRLGVRIRMARQRFTRATAGVTATAVTLIVVAGGFIVYNTNVLNEYLTAPERSERRAEYERRYGHYKGVPQPGLTDINLCVEIYPKRREVEIDGRYSLVNSNPIAIDSIHLAPAPGVVTGKVAFDRPVAHATVDDELGYRIYSLQTPLQPGETLELRFDVRYEPRGFKNEGVDTSVVANCTYFTSLAWLPAIGYQPSRELGDDVERRAHGLASRPAVAPLHDNAARRARVDRVVVESVVGTTEDQTAVAPGTLQRTWTEAGRRYFHYVTDTPIGNEYSVFSANYAVHEEEWLGSGQSATIQIFYHPSNTHNLHRIARSAQASLSYYTTQFGPYPFRYVRFVEHAGRARGMHADADTIDYQEGFSLLNPRADRDVDLPFVVVAHEVAHHWWGTQLVCARVEGAGVLSESLATYSSMRLLEETLGSQELLRYLRFLRLEYARPPSTAMPPLLRATDSFLIHRKGPLALHALGEYIGKERVHAALRRLLEKHGGGLPPLPTTLDLYRELQAVTPDSFQYLLRDLFEKNTFWKLETERATAEHTESGAWRVSLDVRARKVVVEETGVEIAVPIDEWMEVGIFAPAALGQAKFSAPLHLQKHPIHSGRQTITVTVPRKPVLAGIDPRHLLDWEDREDDDNLEFVNTER